MMVRIVIENKPKQTVRPSTKDSNMFVAPKCYGGGLYEGHYMKTNLHRAKRLDGITYEVEIKWNHKGS